MKHVRTNLRLVISYSRFLLVSDVNLLNYVAGQSYIYYLYFTWPSFFLLNGAWSQLILNQQRVLECSVVLALWISSWRRLRSSFWSYPACIANFCGYFTSLMVLKWYIKLAVTDDSPLKLLTPQFPRIYPDIFLIVYIIGSRPLK